MMNSDEITPENCGTQLQLVRESAVISRSKLARILGVPDSTISRIENQESIPRNGFMNKLRGLQVIGFSRFDKIAPSNQRHSVIYDAKNRVTVKGVIYGLMALVTDDMINLNIPLGDDRLDSLGYGIVNSIRKICTANNLKCEESGGQLKLKGSNQKSTSTSASVTAIESVTKIAKMKFPSKNLRKWCQAAGQLIKKKGTDDGFYLTDVPQIIRMASGQEQAQLCSGLFWSAWIDQVLHAVTKGDDLYEEFRHLYPFPRLYDGPDKNYASPISLLDRNLGYILPNKGLLLEDKEEFWNEIQLWLQSLGEQEVIEKGISEFIKMHNILPEEYRYLFDSDRKKSQNESPRRSQETDNINNKVPRLNKLKLLDPREIDFGKSSYGDGGE